MRAAGIQCLFFYNCPPPGKVHAKYKDEKNLQGGM
jgi:hypothetical protein